MRNGSSGSVRGIPVHDGSVAPVFVVAEMSCNHGGSYDNACRIIDAAHQAGADAIKVQIDSPDGGITIACNRKDFMIDSGPWKGMSLYDLYKKTYTPWDWLPGLKNRADNYGLCFFASVSCLYTLAIAWSLDLPIIKISSFEARDIPLIRAAMKTGKRIIVSCGCDWFDAWEELQGYDAQFLYCISSYPATASEFDLEACSEFDGISDHSKGNAITFAAVSRGARVVERHLGLPDVDSPDSGFSLMPNEFSDMVDGIRAIEIALKPKRSRVDLRYCKSLYCVQDINKGGKFTTQNVASIRPGYGMHPKEYDRVLSRKASRDIKRGDRIIEEMLS